MEPFDRKSGKKSPLRSAKFFLTLAILLSLLLGGCGESRENFTSLRAHVLSVGIPDSGGCRVIETGEGEDKLRFSACPDGNSVTVGYGCPSASAKCILTPSGIVQSWYFVKKEGQGREEVIVSARYRVVGERPEVGEIIERSCGTDKVLRQGEAFLRYESEIGAVTRSLIAGADKFLRENIGFGWQNLL